MIRVGTEALYPDDGFLLDGRVERNSVRTGRHLVRVEDKWFDRSSILTGVEWTEDGNLVGSISMASSGALSYDRASH